MAAPLGEEPSVKILANFVIFIGLLVPFHVVIR